MKGSIRGLVLLVAGLCAVFPPLASAQSAKDAGAVFVMTNGVDKNEIIAYGRDANGNLYGGERFDTGGQGSGGLIAPLGSQGSLTLTADHTILLAVNAGSGTISEFRVNGSRLSLLDKTSAAGSSPVAVAVRGGLVYLLDAGGQGSVTGYRLQFDGTLAEIPNSTAFLTPFGGGSGAGSLSISPNGHFLLVTERNSNQVDAFPIKGNGTLGAEVSTTSAGAEAFAGEFAPSGIAVVAESEGDVTSYSVGANGVFTPVSTNVPTLGTATCWIIVTPNGKYVYTSNTASANISGFSISSTGVLTPIGSTVVGSNPSGGFNLDLATSSDGKFLYTIDAAAGAISGFQIQSDGSLIGPNLTDGLPKSAGFQGIAAY